MTARSHTRSRHNAVKKARRRLALRKARAAARNDRNARS